MKTLKELKDFCEKNNVRYELNPRYGKEEYNPWSGEWFRPVLGYFFGMNNIAGRKGESEWQWTWFETYNTDVNENSMFFFSERYSQLNGRSYKGWREESRALNIIETR